ncbi:imidazole glycerol phosphate synthase subunit HisF [Alishewanella longhuensis]
MMPSMRRQNLHGFIEEGHSSIDAAIMTRDWVSEVQRLGAGEIVLNCIDQDGVRQGYDIAQLKTIRDLCKVPLIASGGAGTMQHFTEVFQQADVDGALAASVFHKGIIQISELKTKLIADGISIRP